MGGGGGGGFSPPIAKLGGLEPSATALIDVSTCFSGKFNSSCDLKQQNIHWYTKEDVFTKEGNTCCIAAKFACRDSK